MTVLRHLMLILNLMFYGAVHAEEHPETHDGDATSQVEQFAWPFTRWFEDTVRRTPIIRTQENVEPSGASGGLTLRAAIQQATSIYPGTVLGAKKSLADSQTTFHVRIVSEQGIVKTIVVKDPAITEEGE